MVSLKNFYKKYYLKSKRITVDNKVNKGITLLNLKNQPKQIPSILLNEKKNH